MQVLHTRVRQFVCCKSQPSLIRCSITEQKFAKMQSNEFSPEITAQVPIEVWNTPVLFFQNYTICFINSSAILNLSRTYVTHLLHIFIVKAADVVRAYD